jgi:hypothetical protein
MKKQENIINLEIYRVEKAKVFTGRDRGLFVRNQSQIDEIETKFDEVQIIIPDNIYSINPSFFEELFFNVVNKLGKISFLDKFKFINLGEYNYVKPLNEAIERILRTKTAIG